MSDFPSADLAGAVLTIDLSAIQVNWRTLASRRRGGVRGSGQGQCLWPRHRSGGQGVVGSRLPHLLRGPAQGGRGTEGACPGFHNLCSRWAVSRPGGILCAARLAAGADRHFRGPRMGGVRAGLRGGSCPAPFTSTPALTVSGFRRRSTRRCSTTASPWTGSPLLSS